MPMSKIIQYRNKCIGCAVCYEQQPELWRMSRKDGKATLLKSVNKKEVFVVNVTEAQIAKAKQVAAACPAQIIRVV